MLLNFHSNAIWHIVHGLESSKFQEEKNHLNVNRWKLEVSDSSVLNKVPSSLSP